MARRILSQYHDGELAPVAARRARRHVEACPRCAEALLEMETVDTAVRAVAVGAATTPDIARAVTSDLKARGAFFSARVAAGRRRLFGGRVAVARAAAAVVLAAVLVAAVFAGLDRLSREDWARQTAPVLADADRVLVRLVYVDPEARPDALSRARAEARQLGLPERLADVGSKAGPALAPEFGYLTRTFEVLAGTQEIPADVAEGLARGDVRDRVVRLREDLAARF